ncbi:hypothetical protein [Arenimonas sp.]|uniref:DUF3108 domain-containing protein n=1 Tax=Arenimonas sp. TaxID=1872635 RepID=UPI0039E6E461
MSPILLLALAAPSALPEGGRIAEQDACFTISTIRDGKSTDVGQVRQTVRRVRTDGKDELHVLIHQQAPGGFDMRDSFVLDGKTLRPIHFENRRRGETHVVLDYSDGVVAGRRVEKDGRTTVVHVPLPQPVWEGNLFGVMFAALPLEPKGEYRVPFYQYDKGLGEFRVRVKGSESVSTPDGPVDAWVLDAGTDELRRVEYLIARDDPRELGYRTEGFAQRLGGDCSKIPPAEAGAKPDKAE